MNFLNLKNKSIIIGYVSAILGSALFGAVPAMAKPIVSTIDPLLLSALAYLISSATFTPMAQRSKILFLKKDIWLLFTVAVCGATIAPILYFLGLQQSSASDTSLLSNAEIVFTVLLALIFFKERLKPIGFVAVGLVLFGITVITTNFQASNFLFQINGGHLLILGATAFWALDNNISRIITTRVDTARLVQLKSAIGGSIILGIILVLRIPFQISTEQIPYLVLLSVLGFGGSLYFFLQSPKRIGTVRTIVLFSMASVFGLVFAGLFLHEQISPFQIIAISIMLTGIYLISRKESMNEKDPKISDF